MMISEDHVTLKTGGIISIFQTSCIQFEPDVVHYLNRLYFKSHFAFEDCISQSVCVCVCVCVCLCVCVCVSVCVCACVCVCS